MIKPGHPPAHPPKNGHKPVPQAAGGLPCQASATPSKIRVHRNGTAQQPIRAICIFFSFSEWLQARIEPPTPGPSRDTFVVGLCLPLPVAPPPGSVTAPHSWASGRHLGFLLRSEERPAVQPIGSGFFFELALKPGNLFLFGRNLLPVRIESLSITTSQSDGTADGRTESISAFRCVRRSISILSFSAGGHAAKAGKCMPTAKRKATKPVTSGLANRSREKESSP